MKVVSIENNEIRLNSRLGELSFGKTNYSSVITQTGVLAKCDSFSEGKYHFTFEDWSFDDVKAFNVDGRDERLVFYCGNSAGFTDEAKTLLEYVESDNKDQAFEAGFVMCSLYTQAAEENIQLPLNGGGGILINLDKENTSVLFLPADLYKYSVAGLPEDEYADLYGSWVNQTIYDLPALCFCRGVTAYKILTGKFPYPNSNPVERNADILDRKFLPLELCVNGINKELAKEVNKALKLNSSAVNIPGKKQKGKSSEDLTPTPAFPLELLYQSKDASYETKVSDEEFQQKAEAFLKTQASKVSTKRKLRRNTTTIIITAIAVVVLSIITANFVKARNEEYITKGMTSTEVVQSFLNCIDTKDTITISNLVKGHQPQSAVNVITNIFVISKQRQTYSRDNGFGNLINWMFFATSAEKLEKAGMYAIAIPEIDGKKVELVNKGFMRKDKPAPVTEENGIVLADGAKSVHKAEYLLLHTEEEYNEIIMEYVTQTYTLTYKKDRWFITNIETKNEEQSFNSGDFKYAYLEALKECEYDIVKTADKLRMQYYWLPDSKLIEAEKKHREELIANPFLGL